MKSTYTNHRSGPLMVLFYFLIFTDGAIGYWVMLQHLKNEGFAYYFLMNFSYPFGFISGIYIFISEMRGAYQEAVLKIGTQILGGYLGTRL